MITPIEQLTQSLTELAEIAQVVVDFDYERAEERQWCFQHDSSATVRDGRYRCDWVRWALAQGQTPALCVIGSILTMPSRQNPQPA